MTAYLMVAAATAATLLAPTLVRAEIVTFEPDAFAPGTDISEIVPGVRLWTFQNLGLSTDSGYSLSRVHSEIGTDCVPSALDCAAVTGVQVFGGIWQYAFDAAEFWRDVNLGRLSEADGMFTALLIEFDAPTTFVEISGAWWSGDIIALYAFDASFNWLPLAGTTTWLRGYDFNYPHATASLTSAEPLIKYVIAGSWDEGWSSLDALRFERAESVAEPTSLLLFGSGLLGAAWVRARRPR